MTTTATTTTTTSRQLTVDHDGLPLVLAQHNIVAVIDDNHNEKRQLPLRPQWLLANLPAHEPTLLAEEIEESEICKPMTCAEYKTCCTR